MMFGASPSVPFAEMRAALLVMPSVSTCMRPSPNDSEAVAVLTSTGSTRDWSSSTVQRADQIRNRIAVNVERRPPSQTRRRQSLRFHERLHIEIRDARRAPSRKAAQRVEIEIPVHGHRPRVSRQRGRDVEIVQRPANAKWAGKVAAERQPRIRQRKRGERHRLRLKRHVEGGELRVLRHAPVAREVRRRIIAIVVHEIRIVKARVEPRRVQPAPCLTPFRAAAESSGRDIESFGGRASRGRR